MGAVSVRRTPLAFVALGLVALAGCSTTSVTSPPVGAEGTEATEPEAIESTDAVTSTTVADTTTTVAETTTTVEPTTTTAPPPPTTTTTIPHNVIPVAALEQPIEAVGTGDGDATSRAQWRLLELGFWLAAPDGQYGLTTRQAVMAFQKYYNLPADGELDADTAAWLTNLTEKPRGRSDAGTLVEVDKSKQLLFFISEGVTQWILNTSTGTEVAYEEPNKNDPTKIERGDSVTPVGLHQVNRERAEGWWEGDLGEIYRPKYFVGGVAVHGSNNVPDYPASHGCVRVTTTAMDFIWDANLMPMGIPVWVHGAK